MCLIGDFVGLFLSAQKGLDFLNTLCIGCGYHLRHLDYPMPLHFAVHIFIIQLFKVIGKPIVLDRTGNRRFVPVMVYPERAEVHILDNEEESRAYIHQMWAEAMAIYRSRDFKLRFSPTMNEYLKAHQREFMPEDTKAGQILDYLDSYTGNAVCSKQLYREALGHEYDEPKQWELREINDIMNNVVKGWKSFSNPRHFPKPYLRQKGWERELPDNGEADNGDGRFIPLSDAELEQMELPEGWR